MPFYPSDVATVTEGVGFTYYPGETVPESALSLGSTGRYLKPLDDDWMIEVVPYGLFDKYEYIDVGLVRADTMAKREGFLIGPHHRAMSPESLEKNINVIIAKLRSYVTNNNGLVCPDCKTRWLELKEPVGAATWKPFLSCTGLFIAKGRIDGMEYKYTPCRGKANTPQALVVYS